MYHSYTVLTLKLYETVMSLVLLKRLMQVIRYKDGMDPTLSTESQKDDLFHIKAQSDIFDISSLEKIITLVLTSYKQCGKVP